MILYKVKTDVFRYFEIGDVLQPLNNGLQYSKEGMKGGDPCISIEIIKALPNYFEKLDMGSSEQLFNKFVDNIAEQVIKKIEFDKRIRRY